MHCNDICGVRVARAHWCPYCFAYTIAAGSLTVHQSLHADKTRIKSRCFSFVDNDNEKATNEAKMHFQQHLGSDMGSIFAGSIFRVTFWFYVYALINCMLPCAFSFANVCRSLYIQPLFVDVSMTAYATSPIALSICRTAPCHSYLQHGFLR